MSQQPFNPNDGRWHLRKELNVGHLLTTAVLAGGLVTWGSGIDSRVTTVEVEIEHVKAAQALQREDQRRAMTDVIGELRAIRERIDQLAEKVIRQ